MHGGGREGKGQVSSRVSCCKDIGNKKIILYELFILENRQRYCISNKSFVINVKRKEKEEKCGS